MRYIYLKPQLKDLTQGSRIAFIRAFRKLTQDDVSDKIGFTEEQMKYRNDRLITMYRIFSDYLNCQESFILDKMGNMYERENIFSENGTCTMYLKLKK